MRTSRKDRRLQFRFNTIRALGAIVLIVPTLLAGEPLTRIALYPEDHRREMTEGDYRRFPGAGVLFCRDENNVPQKAAAAWLVGNRTLVMMNAHNFRDPRAEVTRTIFGCFFQIDGKNYEFDPNSLQLGIAPDATALHITDDWALARLRHPVDPNVEPQPLPKAPDLPTGRQRIKITMVSPAGHANLRAAQTSIESCAVEAIDPVSEDGIRRVRHRCNDGYGGSGSGLFDEANHLIAMQSASLDMNRRMPFDVERHYGSAFLIEGELLDLIRRDVEKRP